MSSLSLFLPFLPLLFLSPCLFLFLPSSFCWQSELYNMLSRNSGCEHENYLGAADITSGPHLVPLVYFSSPCLYFISNATFESWLLCSPWILYLSFFGVFQNLFDCEIPYEMSFTCLSQHTWTNIHTHTYKTNKIVAKQYLTSWGMHSDILYSILFSSISSHPSNST